MGRILALDVGDVRIGMALSDPMKIVGSPFDTIVRGKQDEEVFERILGVIRENDVELIVCGLPLRLDGTDTLQTRKVRSFVEELREKTEIEVVLWDERLSTASANRVLIEGNVRREKRKDAVDKIAASVILQSYMESKRF